MVSEILKRLSELVLSEMESKNLSSKDFSIMCGISEREVSSIKNRERSDVRLSIIAKICENTSITYADIFDISDKDVFERMAVRLVLTDGMNRYGIRKLIS